MDLDCRARASEADDRRLHGAAGADPVAKLGRRASCRTEPVCPQARWRRRVVTGTLSTLPGRVVRAGCTRRRSPSRHVVRLRERSTGSPWSGPRLDESRKAHQLRATDAVPGSPRRFVLAPPRRPPTQSPNPWPHARSTTACRPASRALTTATTPRATVACRGHSRSRAQRQVRYIGAPDPRNRGVISQRNLRYHEHIAVRVFRTAMRIPGRRGAVDSSK